MALFSKPPKPSIALMVDRVKKPNSVRSFEARRIKSVRLAKISNDSGRKQRLYRGYYQDHLYIVRQNLASGELHSLPCILNIISSC